MTESHPNQNGGTDGEELFSPGDASRRHPWLTAIVIVQGILLLAGGAFVIATVVTGLTELAIGSNSESESDTEEGAPLPEDPEP